MRLGTIPAGWSFVKDQKSKLGTDFVSILTRFTFRPKYPSSNQ